MAYSGIAWVSRYQTHSGSCNDRPMWSPSCPCWREAIFLNVLERKAVRKVASGESFSEGLEDSRELNFPDQSQWVVVMSRGKSERFSCRERLRG